MKLRFFIYTIIVVIIFQSCKNDEIEDCNPNASDICASSLPIGEDYDLDAPFYFSQTYIPEDNPMKVEAVNLGRSLFWDTRLSGDSTFSCGSCHSPQAAFSQNSATSVGIDGINGNRNSMALVNLAFQNDFFWDGRSFSLEDQALEPVPNPIEMHESWSNAVEKIEREENYVPLFEAAFGSACVDSIRITKAIAQFVRSMVSKTSKYDKWKVGQALLTELELEGLDLWQLEGGDPEVYPPGQFGADCFHCHSIAGGQFGGLLFSNNGLDSVFSDLGLGGISGNDFENGKFKVPTLRNVEYSFPYMHDGRFQNLDEIIDHYNSGGVPSPTIDPFMKFTIGGLDLTPQKKEALKAFLLTLSDPEFINDPKFADPH